MAYDANVDGQLAARDLDPGQHTDQLALASIRIDRGNFDQFHVAHIGQRTARGLQRLLHAVFDRQNDTLRSDHAAHDPRALNDRVGTFTQQHVVACNPRFAFGAVDDQQTHWAGEFFSGWKCRAPEADHGAVLDPFEQLRRIA